MESNASTSRADIARVSYNPTADSAALHVHPELTLRALDDFSTHLSETDSTRVLAGVLEDIASQARELKLPLLHDNTKTFALHASLPGLEFGYAFLKGVRDDHKIIGV